ncbi:MAG: L,D-transpeptidase family protein [Streptomyces sp.]|nr:L,D-transpeptidase family protein [Streptomyces sp.]
MITRTARTALSAAVLVSVLLTGCGRSTPVESGRETRAAAAPAAEVSQEPMAEVSVDVLPQEVPGLGTATRAGIPDASGQVLVVTGEGKDSPRSVAVLYERTADGWQGGPEWPAHNALKGWTGHHVLGDLRSPIGVYTLSDAGGRLPDPGTRLPYHRSSGFTLSGTGFEGEPLEGSFDYVVAIDYNRRPGTSPQDWTRPLGAQRGGGIWLHVDHGGPTQGCVSLAEEHMRDLLRALDPDRHPVVVMGDAASLAR